MGGEGRVGGARECKMAGGGVRARPGGGGGGGGKTTGS